MDRKLLIPSFARESFFITVEGNIGSGKSTFLKKLYESFKFPIALEPHTVWQNVQGHNLLQEFYTNPTRWAYSFQTYVFLSRVKSLEAVMSQHPEPETCFIMERSPYTDKYCFSKACHKLGFMNDLEWTMYCSWYDWFVLGHVQKPAGIIYLRVEPEISYERTKKRNRKEEDEVSLDYLKLLHSYHEDWLIHKKDIPCNLKNIPVLTLDCNKDFEHTNKNWAMLCEDIEQFITTLKNGLS